MKRIKFLNIENKAVISTNAVNAFDRYFKNLDIEENMKKNIQDKINASENFVINVQDLNVLNGSIERRLDDLISSDDFNPFKEELRKKHEKYNVEPWNYKGTIYFLYTKGGEFIIDREIVSLDYYRRLIKDHIEQNIEMKYLFEDK